MSIPKGASGCGWDWDALDELVAPDFVRHSTAAGSPGVSSRDELKRYPRAEYLAFPDAQETLLDLVAEADYLAIYRIAAGRIVEAWAEWDNLAGLVQLGHIEPPG